MKGKSFSWLFRSKYNITVDGATHVQIVYIKDLVVKMIVSGLCLSNGSGKNIESLQAQQ